MKNQSNQGLQVNLEMIVQSSTAVQVCIEDKGNYSSTQKGLLLPELVASGRPASLIALFFTVIKWAIHLQIIDGSREQDIRLTRLLEPTGTFAEFQFIYQGNDDKGKYNDGPDEYFNNIWSTV